MTVRSLDRWTHHHSFLGEHHRRNERRTWAVIALTAAMMILEIVGGIWFGSMALLADGWHMSTHAAALAISAFAYLYARRHANDSRFTFGTGKVGDLAAFASAIVLGMIALLIAYESVMRLMVPVAIAYNEALAVAVLGLAVNLLCAWLLRAGAPGQHDHGHRHGKAHGHSHHRDHNLRAAYVHVLADAATSLLTIAGLLVAMSLNLVWIDALIGLVGAALIGYWSIGLIRDSGRVLLDMVPDRALADTVRGRLESGGDRVTDLHIWQVGPGHRAAVVSIVSDRPETVEAYKDRLADIPGLSHVTVEVARYGSAA
jgi:cation diffusion facilitator family transporter